MPPGVGLPTAIPPLGDALVTEPLVFIAAWLLLGWVLLRANRQAATTAGDPAMVRHQPLDDEEDGLSGLALVLLLASIYYLLRYWRNR